MSRIGAVTSGYVRRRRTAPVDSGVVSDLIGERSLLSRVELLQANAPPCRCAMQPRVSVAGASGLAREWRMKGVADDGGGHVEWSRVHLEHVERVQAERVRAERVRAERVRVERVRVERVRVERVRVERVRVERMRVVRVRDEREQVVRGRDERMQHARGRVERMRDARGRVERMRRRLLYDRGACHAVLMIDGRTSRAASRHGHGVDCVAELLCWARSLEWIGTTSSCHAVRA